MELVFIHIPIESASCRMLLENKKFEVLCF